MEHNTALICIGIETSTVQCVTLQSDTKRNTLQSGITINQGKAKPNWQSETKLGVAQIVFHSFCLLQNNKAQ